MHSIAWWPIFALILVATVTDIKSRRIPNWLVLPFLTAGIAVSTSLHGLRGLGQSAAGIGLAVLVTGILVWLRGMGMGDLKLCAAVGAWVGPDQLGFALVMTFIAGAVIGVVWALCTGSLSKSLDSTGDLLVGFAKDGIRPHGTIVLDNSNTLK